MTSVDRAFIKAYTSRRSVRGASAERAEPRAALVGSGAPSYRVDGPHAAAGPHTSGPQAKSTPRKLRRPSAESIEHTPAPGVMPTVDRAGRERVVVSLSDSAITPDWIWQRQPNPVFADAASTAGAALETPAAKARPTNKQPKNPDQGSPPPTITPPTSTRPTSTQPAGPQPATLLASKVLSPEILSLTASSVGVAVTAGPVAMVPPVAMAPPREVATTAASGLSGPLSSFTLSARIEERLQPALEVDQFLWPAEIARIGRHRRAGD